MIVPWNGEILHLRRNSNVFKNCCAAHSKLANDLIVSASRQTATQALERKSSNLCFADCADYIYGGNALYANDLFNSFP